MASLLSSLLSPAMLWLWELVDALTIIAVAVGCWGESWAERHEFRGGPLNLMPMDFTRRKYKLLFERVVWISLAVEFFAFGLALLASNKEIAELKGEAAIATKLATESKERTVGLEITANRLRLRLADTEKAVGPRTLSWRGGDFLMAEMTSKLPGIRVFLANVANDPDARNLAAEIWQAMGVMKVPAGPPQSNQARPKPPWTVIRDFSPLQKVDFTGVIIEYDGVKAADLDLKGDQSEEAAMALLKMLTDLDIAARVWPFMEEALKQTNTIKVIVNRRPPRREEKFMFLEAQATILIQKRSDLIRSFGSVPPAERATREPEFLKQLKSISNQLTDLGARRNALEHESEDVAQPPAKSAPAP